ncbi:MAG: molecular chaperone HtpG, partial [Treponemataceae bacterium]|nr:molecular chaperone HtpG [Treponemataceae bacterium]
KLLSEFKKMADAADKAVKAAKDAGTDELSEDNKKKVEKWARFVSQFNRPMKEGLYSDYENRETIMDIVRFKSTDESGMGDDKWTSFADYVQRMKPEQKAIYYITGSDEAQLRRSPLLEAYKNKGFEVLIMADDIDDIVIGGVGKYKDFDLKDVKSANSDEELGVDKAEAEKKEEAFKPVVEKLKTALGEKVKDVVLSKRLTDSPSCIVVDENDPSFQMIRMMKAMGQDMGQEFKPILEVNGDHALVAGIKDCTDDAYVEDVANVLLYQALLVDGGEIKDPADFVQRMNRLLTKA